MKDKKKDSAGGDNPVARLKLLLIASFTTLHILNLITPLAPNYQHGSDEKGSLSLTSGVKHVQTEGGSVRRVDITEPGVRGALDAFAFALGSKSLVEDESDESSATSEEKTQLLVRLSPPIWVRVVPSPELVASSTSNTPSQPTTPLERFMSSWTRLVGDPVISKWIVVVLAISISLNGYLLKGIAAGLGLGLGLVRKDGDGVRFSDSEGEESKYPQVEKVEKKKVVMPTFTLDDVDRKLKADGVVVRKRRGTVGAAAGSPVRPVYLPTPPSRHVPTPLSISLPPQDVIASSSSEHDDEGDLEVAPPRPLKELIEIYENGPKPASLALEMLTDEEVILLAQNGKIAAYALEKVFGNERLERAVRIRRALVCEFVLFSIYLNGKDADDDGVARASKTQTLEYADIPMRHYDYSRVLGACCENVVGYIPLPLGIAGPLNVDGELYPIPMATAEVSLLTNSFSQLGS
jgi:hydroxymethylglutaryl-CoA reductase (NADPH)